MLKEVNGQKLMVKSNEDGQVLLIVILVVIVSLTIGLSLASRGITTLRTSTEEADSQKALSAAEAEIERRLQDTAPGTFTGAFGSSSFTTTVDPQGGESFLLNGGSMITQGEGIDVWFAEHDAGGSIILPPPAPKKLKHFNIYWGTSSEQACDPSDPSGSRWPAAIEVIVVTGDSPANATTKHYAYDYCHSSNGTTNRGNNFFPASLNNSTDPLLANFEFSTPEGVNDLAKDTDDVIFMRVIPVYKNTIIGVRACNHGGGNCRTLPSQGFQISSTGTTGTTSRKLNVFKGHEQIFLPYISYGLFVPTR